MLWFVTPAWGRPELSNVVFAQRQALCQSLGAKCVVVADDENLDIAQHYGLDTVEQDNLPLGRKINDGFEYARKHGATHVCPLDSDSWALAKYFVEPFEDTVMSSTWLGIVPESGKFVAHLDVLNQNNPYGSGPFVIPTKLIPKRPLDEGIQSDWNRGIIEAHNLPVEFRHTHRLQEVTFKNGQNLNGFNALSDLMVATHDLCELGRVYPNYLVSRIARLYRV